MYRRLTYAVLFLLAGSLGAQECPGGLGENLFEDGDFGSGSDFSLAQDPGLAPGYLYNRTGPPADGEYMITNDFNQWDFVFDTWLRPRDNSNDPDGYMMVVNASFEPGLFYEEMVEGLCDNTSYEFSADLINLIRIGVPGHSDPNVDFLIDDEVVFSTGNIAKNERWNTFAFSFDTDPSQTSVQLSLRNNAPGGIGNDLALDNISFRACGPASVPTIVQGDDIVCQEDFPLEIIAFIEGAEDMDRRYGWQVSNTGFSDWEDVLGQEGSRLTYEEFREDQRMYFRFFTAATQASFLNEKCRFFSDTISVFVPKRNYERFDTICGGTSLQLGTAELVSPGTFVEELVSSRGCDSIVTIHLDTVQREVLTADVTGFDPSCADGGDGSIQAANVTGGNPPYNIHIFDTDAPDLIVDGLTMGVYDIEVQDRFNCFVSDQITLEDPPVVMIDIGEDLDIILGEEVDISADANFDIDEITWSEDLMDFNGMTDFTFLPIRDQIITVEAISEDGCIATDEIGVEIDTEVSIYIPNVFSPNGDNVEDEFFISPFGRSLGVISTFNIYDRWGGLIWAASDDNLSWSGTDESGRQVIEGTYAYILEGALINGDPIQFAGTILLTR